MSGSLGDTGGLFGGNGGGGSLPPLVINVPADFPTTQEANSNMGRHYFIGGSPSVTDNDPTKTNTGQTFLIGQDILWDGISAYFSVGNNALWVKGASGLEPVSSADNLKMLSGHIIESVATPQTLLAAETITATEMIIPVSGNGGAITLTSDPQIAAGTVNGETKTLIGTDDTNTLTVVNGSGLSTDNGLSFTLGEDDNIKFTWYNSRWIETARKDNVRV